MLTATNTRTSPIPTATVNLRPTEYQLTVQNADLYYAIDLLVTQDGFIGQNIMKPRGEKVLFWDWAIISEIGYEIPAPVHSSSPGTSQLYRWNDEPVTVSNEEYAFITSIFYMDMLCRITRDWKDISKHIHPLFIGTIDKGAQWIKDLQPGEYQKIVFALKSQLSEKGHCVLD